MNWPLLLLRHLLSNPAPIEPPRQTHGPHRGLIGLLHCRTANATEQIKELKRIAALEPKREKSV